MAQEEDTYHYPDPAEEDSYDKIDWDGDSIDRYAKSVVCLPYQRRSGKRQSQC